MMKEKGMQINSSCIDAVIVSMKLDKML